MHNFHWFIVFVALNSAILWLLTANVSRLRIKHKVTLGDGGNNALMSAIRVHANGVEQVPVYGLIILALTLADAPNILLAILVLLFTGSRVFHAYGMLFKKLLLRQIGAAITYGVQVFAIVSLLVCLG